MSDDGQVIGLHHNSAERNGKQLDTGCCIVFEIEDGRLISGREHFYDLGNWDDFRVVAKPGRARRVTLTATAEGALEK